MSKHSETIQEVNKSAEKDTAVSSGRKSFDYRVRFSKHGALKYIGHLDVMRFFQKVLRRAEVDVAYTNGFSPHEITTFAQPLGVGIESDGEYMDIKMNSFISCSELKNLINLHSVPEIQAVSVKLLPEKSGNAMASVVAAEYFICFKENKYPDFPEKIVLPEKISDFVSQPEIILTKEGKAGIRSIDIKDRIYSFIYDDNKGLFHAIVDSSSGYNIKPFSLMELFVNFCGAVLKENSLKIYRVDTYTRDSMGNLISMGDIGTDE